VPVAVQFFVISQGVKGMCRTSNFIIVLVVTVALLAPAAMSSGEDDLMGATYLGGAGDEGWIYSGAISAAIAATGEVYIVGMTASTDFPTTPGAFQCVSCGGYDIFVAKMSGDLTALLASTVFGGSQDEILPSVVVSSDGTVYVAGHTNSSNFPVTMGAYDRFADTNADVYVARFDGDLTILLAATYLGGNGADLFPTIDLDLSGAVVVCGVTSSGATNTFPTTPGAYDRTYSASYADFFVSKLSGDLSQLMASTFLGGRYEEAWSGAMVDPLGNIMVGGSTESNDYPSTPGAYEELFHGPPRPGQYIHDVVVSKLSNDLDSLLASTFIGTDGFDGGQQITVDNDGNVIIGGHTDAIDYPVTPGALDEHHNGQNEYLLTKIDNDLATILASTFLTPDDAGFTYLTDLATDADGNVYGVGAAWADNCPITSNAYDTTFNGGANDFALMQLSGDLTTLTYATYLGGAGDEGDCAVAIDSVGNVITAGYTSSSNMSVTPGAYDGDFNGGTKDVHAARFQLDDPSVPVFLADFDYCVGYGVVDFAWRVGEDATVNNFRLTARSPNVQWDLPIIGVSNRRFEAHDTKPVERSDGEFTYHLYSREQSEPWLLLRTITLEKKVPEAGVKIFGVYPSPSARDASISFSVGYTQHLEIEVYDVAGRRTALLANRVYPAGRHSLGWDGRDTYGRQAASGVYFLRISGDRLAVTRKFAVVR
jgi:hypothetical protein